MNQAQHDWIERLITDNAQNPAIRVVIHEGLHGLVEVREKTALRERCIAVIRLDDHGKPIQIDQA